MARTTIAEIQQLKGRKKIVTMTSYDYEMARLMERAGTDILLVGDTGCKYALGGNDIEATVDEMVLMTAARLDAVHHPDPRFPDAGLWNERLAHIL